ncbi:hypothetical protein C2G38_2112639 [Gigaspora rosea]|uniref:Uncharacterized protein n=1 Tax=Gigaspora rosea TaxID=44941 RepID=A0A397UFH4_9GLOM|nr:hypothetical protein C2G38_2112639 [Gigaspora rosea]
MGNNRRSQHRLRSFSIDRNFCTLNHFENSKSEVTEILLDIVIGLKNLGLQSPDITYPDIKFKA